MSERRSKLTPDLMAEEDFGCCVQMTFNSSSDGINLEDDWMERMACHA